MVRGSGMVFVVVGCWGCLFVGLPVYFYSSSSGYTRRFAEALSWDCRDLGDVAVRRSVVEGHWVLMTPSYCAGGSAGESDTFPRPVLSFLGSAENRRRLVGVIGSGNRNFGAHYQRAARELCRLSGRPMVFEFELSGLPEDVVECRRRLVELEEALCG